MLTHLKISNDDEKYLMSRIQFTASENSNESFQSGKILIIVTTNAKKDLINHHKLSQLLPNQHEYCHTWLHLGFSAKLRIWQVRACKMKPRSGSIT